MKANKIVFDDSDVEKFTNFNLYWNHDFKFHVIMLVAHDIFSTFFVKCHCQVPVWSAFTCNGPIRFQYIIEWHMTYFSTFFVKCHCQVPFWSAFSLSSNQSAQRIPNYSEFTTIVVAHEICQVPFSPYKRAAKIIILTKDNGTQP